ncbi:MAG TPA: hypothetical protein VEQ59_23595 [Polyangiaceae bacterium]|nr:hypothetical protein [Polyangiaceae bacterium]
MNAPRRWIDDAEADEELRELLRGTPRAVPLDPLTRRRLGAKLARASALPAAAAGWLFVKSAAAALGVVLGTGAIAVSAGVLEWQPREAVEAPAQSATAPLLPKRAASPAPARVEAAAPPVTEPPPTLNPTPSLPSAPAVSAAAGTLSAEAALLEQARGQMRSAPSRALARAAEHARRFPRGQLAAERTLIQIEALHRLGRDDEARTLSRGLLVGESRRLYAERISRLLGALPQP